MIFLQIWNDDFQQRILALRGDLNEYHFGFDNATYEDLANKIDIIIHCAAVVNFVLPYKTLYNTNVNGTREIIRLAAHPSTYIPIKYISTMSVVPNGMKHDISIENIFPNYLHNGYAQSKWVSEILMTKANQIGIPVVIYRLGSIGAHNQTGACNKHDLNTLLISTILKIGCYPSAVLRKKLNQLPVDLASRDIISTDQVESDIYGNIYHIVNSNKPISFQSILECICQCGLKLHSVSDDEWKNELITQTQQSDFIKSIGEVFIHHSFEPSNPNTIPKNELAETSRAITLPDENNYLMKWLTFIIKNILFIDDKNEHE